MSNAAPKPVSVLKNPLKPAPKNQPEFVDRINNPSKHPFVRNRDGSISTHRMAAEYDEIGDRWIVFPMIQMKEGKLQVYEDNQVEVAKRSAINSSNFLEMSKNDAINYAKGGYKTKALKAFGRQMSQEMTR